MPRGRPKKVKVSASSKFGADLVSSSVVSKYGDVVRTGTEVLEAINSLNTIGVSPALTWPGGGLGRLSRSVTVTRSQARQHSTTLAAKQKQANVLYMLIPKATLTTELRWHWARTQTIYLL